MSKPENLVELKSKYGFYLKPIAKLNISVQLPQLSTGKTISTTSVMEKINKRAKLQFKSLKITKTTIDFLRFEGELESLKQLDIVEQRLDGVKIKLDGFDEQFKLKANKVKIGPFRHDWETFFRDNPHMDELKPGYRPDTVLIQNIPLKWFRNGNDILKTNWLISIFSVFGDIRRFHIPLLDEIEKEKQSSLYKKDEKSSFKKFNFNSEKTTFDVYLMYKDYIGFMNAIDGLRGMKLVKCQKDDDECVEEHEIKLDFDKTKHLSDKAIRRRQIAKKYGIETLEDLNEYKKKAKERKVLYEQRMKKLKEQKKSSKNLLKFLARLVEVNEKKREKEESKALNEKLLKERLIEEEKKLRNKLIERQRNLMMEKLKENGEFKGEKVDYEELNNSFDKNSYERNSLDNYSKEIPNHNSYGRNYYKEFNKEFNHKNFHLNFNNQRPNFNQNYHNSKHEFPKNQNFRNPMNPSFNHQQHRPKFFEPSTQGPDFIFKNPNFTPKINKFRNNPDFNQNNHQSNSFNPRFPHKLSNNPKPHFTPYQTNKQTFNRTYNHQNKNHNERFNERLNYDEKSNNYQDKPDYQDRSNNYSNKPDYQDKSNNYLNKPNYPGYLNRQNNHTKRSNYQERFNNYQEKSNYHERSNYYDNSFNKLNYRDNKSNPFDKSNNYCEQDNEDEQEEKSTRPKSLVVLPQR